ncbi:hypothetical protein SLA2020_228480 [Shorea laevis]
MLPISDSPEPQRKPKSPEQTLIDHQKSSSNSLHSLLQPYLSPYNPLSWLIFSVLFLQIVLLLMTKSLPLSTRRTHFPSPYPNYLLFKSAANISYPEQSTNFSSSDQCSFGRIFVYDLPSEFNRELIEKCDELSPWSSKCAALSNEGLGKRATGLSGIVPKELIPAWYWTDQFASELIFHNRMLNHKCRTMEAESATGYYIPFYAGLAVGKYLWFNYTAKDRDRYCEMMLRWVQGQPYWNRSNGWDHFIMMGRITWDFRRSKEEDWGSSCIYMPGMRNMTRLLIERNPWDYFDVGVPYPTGFHPRSDADILHWQDYIRSRHRSTLFCFAGATRGKIKNDFRGLLLSHCKNESSSCRVVDCAGTRCSNGTSAILETFLDSDFCLQPRGDSFTRRSIFDCMVAGSIPVFFWHRTAYFQYEWFLPEDPRSYSVFIDRNDVKNGTSVKNVLEQYSKEEVWKMREKVIDYIPKLVYAKPNQGLETIKDAFDIAIDGALKRFKEQKQPGYKWK